MSYLVLARKWRPQRFEDVVGQKAVVRTLRNALARNRVAHAMIFSGVRGVGKTTLARIMAKAINCTGEQEGIPCNRCPSCLEFTSGNALDLHEIDGASNRGIQEIRDLKEDIRFLPSRSRFKIYIIDEVHMLTTEAFNALLKTLEEPPEHVFFMFATTEIHKVPITILSRCQRYELHRIAFRELQEFFAGVIAEEGRTISEDALQTIVREAGGSVRDGLSLLDQIFSYGGESISQQEVTEVLGLVDSGVFRSLAESILTGDLALGLELLDRCFASGADLKRLANDLLQFFRKLMICRTSKNPAAILDAADRELEDCRELAGRYSAETLFHYFQLLLKGMEELQHAAQPRMHFEMTLIRLAQAGKTAPLEELLARLEGLAGECPPSLPRQASQVTDTTSAARQKKASASVWPPGTAAGESSPALSTPTEAEAGPAAPERTNSEAEKVAAFSPALEQVLDKKKKDVRKDWDAFVNYVKDRKPWMAHVLRLCASAREDSGRLLLRYDNPSDCKVMQEAGNLKSLTEFSQDFFQRELRIQFVAHGSGSPEEGDDKLQGPVEERRALANDPLVQMTTEIFGGQIANIRTGPRSR
jgi:DNA polymerase-3 subunit gamma/tau